MFCENCGELLDDGVLFCTKCGQRVTQGEAAQIREDAAEARAEMSQVREEAAAAASIVDLPVQKPGKSSKKMWLWIALAAVLVVVLAVGLANYKVLANSMGKLVMSPQEYYAYIEKNALEDMTSGFRTYYDKAFEAYGNMNDQSMEYSLDVELGELICDLLTTSLEIEDATGLSKIGMDFKLSMKEQLFFGELAGRLGDDRLISVNAVADLDKSMVYAQLPELSGSYIGMDISESAEEITTAVDEYVSAMEVYPSGEALEGILNRYATIIIDSFAEVSEEKAVVTVEEMEQKSTKLCASMTEAEAVAMLEHVLTEMKADEELIDMLAAFATYAEGMEEAEFRALILDSFDEYLANVETYKAEADADRKFIMSIWVSNKGEIIGREFAVDELIISYLMPAKGQNYNYQMLINVEGTEIEALGAGTKTDSDMTGEFVVKMDSVEYGELKLFDVTLEHLNLDKWEKGLEEISYRIKPAKELYVQLGAGAASSLLADYELVYEMNAEEKETTTSLAIVNGEQLLFKLNVFARIDSAMDVAIPAESILVEGDEDLMNWLTTVDFDGFMENLKQSDMPTELLDIIESYVNEFKTIVYYD